MQRVAVAHMQVPVVGTVNGYFSHAAIVVAPCKARRETGFAGPLAVPPEGEATKPLRGGAQFSMRQDLVQEILGARLAVFGVAEELVF